LLERNALVQFGSVPTPLDEPQVLTADVTRLKVELGGPRDGALQKDWKKPLIGGEVISPPLRRLTLIQPAWQARRTRNGDSIGLPWPS
jgi:hypothetical protein